MDVAPCGNSGAYKWNGTDATSCPDSGSLQLSSDLLAGTYVATTISCVGVTAGKQYDFGAMVRLPPASPAGQVYMRVYWAWYADCHAGPGPGAVKPSANPAILGVAVTRRN
jgi:hypothetical protein